MNFLGKISVIIACFNYGRFIEEAIESVLESTFQDFEIVVVDDGSTDPETIRVLDALDHPRIRLVRQKNQGLAMARNNGIEASFGEYFLPLDADDKIAPTMLEKFVAVLETRPDVGFVYSWIQFFGDENRVFKTQDADLSILREENICCGCSLVRKEAWREVGGYVPGLYGYEDWNLWITLVENGWLGVSIPEILFYYRRHGKTMLADGQSRHWYLMGEMGKLHAPMISEGAHIGAPLREGVALVKKFQNKLTSEDLLNWRLWKQSPWYMAKRTIPNGIKWKVKVVYWKIKSLFLRGKKEAARREILAGVARRGTARLSAVALAKEGCAPTRGEGVTKKSILYILPTVSVGGVEKTALDTIQALRGEFDFTIIVSQKGEHAWAEAFRSAGAQLFFLEDIRDPSLWVELLRGVIALRRIEVIHIANSIWGYSQTAWIKEKFPHIRIIDIFQGGEVEGGVIGWNRQFEGNIDQTIVVNSGLFEKLIHKGSPREKFICIPNGVSLLKFSRDKVVVSGEEIRWKWGLPLDRPIISFVSRLSSEKNPLFFLEVAKAIHAARTGAFFVVAGSGYLQDLFLNKRAELKLEHSLRYFPHLQNIPELLSVSSVLVNTSLTEGWSVAILEAMAMEVPVVASRIWQNAALVEEGKTGLLADLGNVNAYRDSILQVLDDPYLSGALALNARKKVVEEYGIAKMASRYRDLYFSY
ncbi:MAG: family 2 glycosyl transferase [Parcubacteria group bacterium Gr01-1014_18]|nr:MAG: family 2 glycosyl transferase [Parcubacteria group bacterium Greene0416_36]TSC81383.1 MAG: family 2 glycosyl transferase [Parcubacteria group bacterium Gr01-1014_18]TSC99431.1 MAG: family 2 glycosyl transferase [Parcubacteria group bacterium Greene1014_20]TSD07650.1 MAG: family 2 glycosyl transferase [Parcubacteria group bacterium Greene0714_2]